MRRSFPGIGLPALNIMLSLKPPFHRELTPSSPVSQTPDALKTPATPSWLSLWPFAATA
jgi:hypothetical protein